MAGVYPGTPSPTAPTPGREPRSRLDRPCDACRRHKHLCMIPVRGEPCVSCKTRRKECTFSMPPTARKRKPRPPPTSAPSAQAGSASASTSAPSTSSAGAGPSGSTPTSAHQQTPTAASSTVPGHTAFGVPTSNLRLDPSLASGEWMTSPFVQTPSDMSILDASGLGGLGEPSQSTDLDRGPSTLEPRDGDEEESHFVGSGALLGLMLKGGDAASPLFQRQATMSFRQVSTDMRLPAYFIKHPTLMYGRGPNSAFGAFTAMRGMCEAVGPDVAARAIQAADKITFPAIPFINGKTLEIAYAPTPADGTGVPVPYGLLAGVVAHATSYIPEIRPLHKNLWSQALLALEDEYRQPRLRTLQLALLVLTSRPSENAGQREIGVARLTGAAHLLGLHMDPTHWTLPAWERSIRKRIWWTLLVHDKWGALLYGRPSHLHKDNYNVPVPTVEESDIAQLSYADRMSLESFVATCRLTEIVDKLLSSCFTVQSILNPAPALSRLASLEAIRNELAEFESTVPAPLRMQGRFGPDLGTLPTGVRSFQLSLCGLSIITNRLILESLPDLQTPQAAIALQNALASCQRLTEFVLSLSTSDRDLFWMPYSSHHISNGVSLLLRLVLADPSDELQVGNAAVTAVQALADSLIMTSIGSTLGSTWDVADSALRRITTLLLIASQEVPVLADTYRAVVSALNLPVPGEFGPGTVSVPVSASMTVPVTVPAPVSVPVRAPTMQIKRKRSTSSDDYACSSSYSSTSAVELSPKIELPTPKLELELSTPELLPPVKLEDSSCCRPASAFPTRPFTFTRPSWLTRTDSGRIKPADQLLESLGVAATPGDWLGADLSWLDSVLLYGALDSSSGPA